MTTLEAVNQILRGLGEPPATALDTGGTSIVGEAETLLNESNSRIQRRGWRCNEIQEYELAVSTIKVGFTGSTGTFVFDETVTQSGSGATGKFSYIDGAFMYLRPIAGTFTNSGSLTGGTSGATRTTASYAAQTSSKMPVSSSWLVSGQSRPRGVTLEHKNIVVRGGFFYDTDDLTDVFTASLKLDIIERLAFIDLPGALAEYVAKDAAVRFQTYKKRGTVDAAFIEREATMEKLAAIREDNDMRPRNFLDTAEAHRVKGNRVSVLNQY